MLIGPGASPPSHESTKPTSYYFQKSAGRTTFRHKQATRKRAHPQPSPDALNIWGSTHAEWNRAYTRIIMNWWLTGNTGMSKLNWEALAAANPQVNYNGDSVTLTGGGFFLLYQRHALAAYGFNAHPVSPLPVGFPHYPVAGWFDPGDPVITAVTKPNPLALVVHTSDPYVGYAGFPGVFLAPLPATTISSSWPHYISLPVTVTVQLPGGGALTYCKALAAPWIPKGRACRVGMFQFDTLPGGDVFSPTTWFNFFFPA